MRAGRVVEVAKVFAWLGATAFGGPAAHVALMRSELVDRRKWVDEATFVDLVGVTALLPGPNSTELAIELGRRRAGTRGLFVAGVAFILPAALAVGALAALYGRYDRTDEITDLRYGIVPVVAALIAHATWKLGRTAIRDMPAAVVAFGAAVAYVADVHELLILAVGAGVTSLWHHRGGLPRGPALLAPWIFRAPAVDEPTGTGLLSLFAGFVRIGALLFGSGYVIVAFLRAEYVERLGLITPEQLVDAVVIGQVTPGPVFTTATFIGYLLHGTAGAVVATVGIFLPAFVLVLLLGRWIGPLLSSPAVRPALTGLNAASVGLIAGVAVSLIDEGVVDVLTAVVAAAALAVLWATRLNPTWVIAGGVALGAMHAIV